MAIFGGQSYNLGSLGSIADTSSMGLDTTGGYPAGLLTDANGNTNGDPNFDWSTATAPDGSPVSPISGGVPLATAATVGPGVGTGIGTLVGTLIGGRLGLPTVGGLAGGAAGDLLTSYLGGGGARGGRRRGTHMNRSTYYTKSGKVAKGTKLVTNRRRNAGNAKAVRRALGRLAMFDNLARKVEGEMQRVARRHHRAAPRAAHHRGHRPGCRCFACRKR